MTDLAQFIQATPIVDTHEHTFSEEVLMSPAGPDVILDLFGVYISLDIHTAGVPAPVLDRVREPSNPDIAARWKLIESVWPYCRFTGYGEAVRYAAREVYGIEEITAEALRAAVARNADLRRPGERLRLLRDVANLDHVQINHHLYTCLPDPSGPEFFLYDIGWTDFVYGSFDAPALYEDTGVDVKDTASLRRAIACIFEKNGPLAIAVKAAHAYGRTLAWTERADEEVEPLVQRILRGEALNEPEQLCLGDWMLARGMEHAIEYNLPVKFHTGILVSTFFNAPPVTFLYPDRTRASHLGPLFARYPQARCVLMHMAYPYCDELVAVAKHFPSVYVDMCWGWSLDPYAAVDFMRRLIHAVPVNKVFMFGGDVPFPALSVAHAWQARQWFTRALQAEVDAGDLSEADAIFIAGRMMRENQYACFDVEGRRAAIRARVAAG